MKTPTKAIGEFCAECAGTVYDVPLCHIDDCPLWPHRLGCRPGNKKYAQRVRRAWETKPDAAKELTTMGKTLADLLGKWHVAHAPRENAKRSRGRAG